MMCKIFAVVLALLAFSGTARAQCTTYPYTLSNGNTADASQVMADFNYMVSCLAGLGGVTSLNTSTGALTLFSEPQGRLTLQSGTPVNTSSTSGATTIYYSPYKGPFVPMWNGAAWSVLQCAEISNITTNSSTGNAGPAAVAANSNYDLFVWSNAGACVLTRGPVWTNNTTRANTLDRLNGILVNHATITNGPGANRGTYVGTVHSNGSSTIDYIFGGVASGGSACSFNVWNTYNRVSTVCSVTDNGPAYTYSTGAARQARNSAGNQGSFVVGLSEDAFTASNTFRNGTAAVLYAFDFTGVGLDGANFVCQASLILNYAATNQDVGLTNTCPFMPPNIGFHTILALESSDGTNANNFDIQSGNTLLFVLKN